MSGPYEKNPFAVLGVPRDASSKAIASAIDRRMMELRLAGQKDESAEHELRAAAQALRDPVTRFSHELYWPLFVDGEATAGALPDPAQYAVDKTDPRSAHNAAVLAHRAAIAAGEQGDWETAFASWGSLFEWDDFWEYWASRVLELADPRLRVDRIEQLKRELPAAILATAAAPAAQAIAAGKIKLARFYLEPIVKHGFSDAAIEEAKTAACAPLTAELDRLSAQWEEQTRTFDEMEAKQGKKISKKRLNKAWAKMRTAIGAPGKRARRLDSYRSAALTQARDRAAKTLRSFAVTAFNTQQCRDLAKEALDRAALLAVSNSERKRIAKDQRDLDATEEDDTCAFCGEPANGGRAKPIHLHRITGIAPATVNLDFLTGGGGGSARYSTIELRPPRCAECKKIHAGKPSETHALAPSGLGCMSFFFTLLLAGGALGLLYYARGYLDGWDWAAAVALWLALSYLGILLESASAARAIKGKILTRASTDWQQWWTAADLLAEGYQTGKEPSQETVNAYVGNTLGMRERYRRTGGSRFCRGCGKLCPGNADRCPECGGERLSRQDPAQANPMAVEPPGKPSALGLSYFCFLLLALAITLRPVREEYFWRYEKTDSARFYRKFLRDFPASRHVPEARKQVERLDWAEAKRSGGYWTYTHQHPKGPHALEAVQALDRLTPWEGRSLERAIRTMRSIERTPQMEEFLWSRVEADRSDQVLLAYLKHKGFRYATDAAALLEENRWERVRTNGSLRDLKAYLKSYPSSRYAEQARKLVANWPWLAARKSNSIVGYRNFLRRYPKSPQAPKARELLLELDWKRAQSRNSESGYKEFRRAHPKSKYEAEVRRRVEEFDWVRVKRSRQISDYEAYLRVYPQGAHRAEALRFVDESYWRQARRSNRPDSYRGYLKRVPQGTHREEARQRIADADWKAVVARDRPEDYRKLIESESPAAERAKRRLAQMAFENAMRKHTIAAYDFFLKKNPKCEFADRARALRENLQNRRDPVKQRTSAFLARDIVRSEIDLRELQTRHECSKLHRRLAVAPQVARHRAAAVKLRKDPMVLGIVIDGHARAYTLGVLLQHHVLNDVIAGVPVALQCDFLSGATGAFDRRVGDRILIFAPTREVYRCTSVYYDTETESFWSPVRGRAVAGTLAGTDLNWIPTSIASWSQWRAAHPNTRISFIATKSPPNYRPNRALEGTRTTGPPYPTGPHKTRKGIPAISWAQVVRENGKFRAYPHSLLRTGTLSDGDTRIRKGKLGVHVLRGTTLLPSMPIYWRAWCSHFPDAPVYESKKK